MKSKAPKVVNNTNETVSIRLDAINLYID